MVIYFVLACFLLLTLRQFSYIYVDRLLPPRQVFDRPSEDPNRNCHRLRRKSVQADHRWAHQQWQISYYGLTVQPTDQSKYSVLILILGCSSKGTDSPFSTDRTHRNPLKHCVGLLRLAVPHHSYIVILSCGQFLWTVWQYAGSDAQPICPFWTGALFP